MSAPVDSRLLDLFATVDDQVEAPPIPDGAVVVTVSGSRDRRARRARRPLALALAAAIVAVLLGAGIMWRTDADGDDVVSSPTQVEPAVFDERVGEVCDVLARARAGAWPRFDTLEAHRVVATARIEAIDRAQSELEVLGAPDDDPALPGRVAGGLAQARALAVAVLDQRTVPTAAERWRLVDPAIDRAISPFAAHGATPCGT